MKYKHKTITLKNNGKRTKEFFLLFCRKHFGEYSDNAVNGSGFLFVDHEYKTIGECDPRSQRKQESAVTDHLTDFADVALEEKPIAKYDLIRGSEFFLYKLGKTSYISQKCDQERFRLVWNSDEGLTFVEFFSFIKEFRQMKDWEDSIVPVELGEALSQAAKGNL